MTAKTGKYSVDPLFHAIYHDNDPTTVYFMNFTHNKVEATQALNGLPCIISKEILIKPNDFITISGIKRATMGMWDKYKHTFTNPD